MTNSMLWKTMILICDKKSSIERITLRKNGDDPADETRIKMGPGSQHASTKPPVDYVRVTFFWENKLI
jgi:hypothetical protein